MGSSFILTPVIDDVFARDMVFLDFLLLKDFLPMFGCFCKVIGFSEVLQKLASGHPRVKKTEFLVSATSVGFDDQCINFKWKIGT